VDCRGFGHALAEIGGARRQVTDALDLEAGIDVLVRRGERVARGQPLAWIRARDAAAAARAAQRVREALAIAAAPTAAPPLVLGRIEDAAPGAAER